MLGFRCKAIDDCGAFPRYEPLGCIIWAQVTPGCYRWQNVRVDFTQVCTNKSPVSPNRGYSRMQHLWLTERIDRHRRHRARARPGRDAQAQLRARRRDARGRRRTAASTTRATTRAASTSRSSWSTTPAIEERRREAEARGKLLGVGIGSTLDSGTNNFGQSQLLNPDLQFSGNNEVATVKLDIFGEIVVTLGTVPQGQGHETTAAQVVADILGVTPDDVTVRPGHDTLLELARRLLRHLREQFAVTGLGAVKGAADKLAGEIKKVAGARARRRAAGGDRARGRLREDRARTPRPRSRSWASARS